METTIIVGSSQTRMVSSRMVTPRGYKVPAARSASKGEPTPLLALRAGDEILKQSFAIIEHELGLHNLPPWVFDVVRRMIHASADFEFARTIRYSADFEAAIRSALLDQRPIVTDTEMVRIGIRAALARYPEVTLACHLNDSEAFESAAANWTRTAAGIRIAARRYVKPILVVGNAPTALDEALRLVEEDGWRPTAIIGMPVGFVGVEEAKSRLLRQSAVPYLTCVGRKGGSAVAAAAVNALIELFGPNSNA